MLQERRSRRIAPPYAGRQLALDGAFAPRSRRLLVEDRRARIDPGLEGMLTQQARAERVDRRYARADQLAAKPLPQPAPGTGRRRDPRRHQLVDAPPRLGRRPVGERDGEDAVDGTGGRPAAVI